MFSAYKRAPVVMSDHYILLLRSRFNYKSNSLTRLKSPPLALWLGVFALKWTWICCFLRQAPVTPVFPLHDRSQCCVHPTLVSTMMFGAPMRHYVRFDRFSSLDLEQFRRAEERMYKDDLLNTIKRFVIVNKSEIWWLNALYADNILGKKSLKEIWRVLKQPRS